MDEDDHNVVSLEGPRVQSQDVARDGGCWMLFIQLLFDEPAIKVPAWEHLYKHSGLFHL